MDIIYISGKITGVADHNIPKFREVEGFIQGLNPMAEVINPHKIPTFHDKKWHSYMREDIKAICRCNIVFVLNDWKQSPGAIIEVFTAKFLRIQIINAATLQEVKISKLRMILLLSKAILKRC